MRTTRTGLMVAAMMALSGAAHWPESPAYTSSAPPRNRQERDEDNRRRVHRIECLRAAEEKRQRKAAMRLKNIQSNQRRK